MTENNPLVKFKADTVPYSDGSTIVYVMTPPKYETGQGAFSVPSVAAGLYIANLLNEALKGA